MSVGPYLTYASTEELLSGAKRQADAVEAAGYRRTVQLYYIARYFVSLYESRDQKVPLQVWNEYRNAFDHFARHLTVAPDLARDDEHHHLNKMEGHVQRAVLDICKFLCLYYDSFYQETVLADVDTLRLVSNGDFLKEANQVYASAKAQLLRAKQSDSNLGETPVVNDDVVTEYCNAVFLFKRIEDLYEENNANVVEARVNFKKLQSLSFVQQGVLAAVIAAVFFALGQFL